MNVIDFMQRIEEVMLEILEGEMKNVAEFLNIKLWKYTFHRYNEISFVSPEEKHIYFKNLTNFDFDSAMKTICHELRHQYQNDVINGLIQDKNKSVWTNAYKELVNTKEDSVKYHNILEVDARAFAEYYCEKFIYS
ncbi:MAG: hypothetical protein R3Y05_05970 [bacterium]